MVQKCGAWLVWHMSERVQGWRRHGNFDIQGYLEDRESQENGTVQEYIELSVI